MMGVVIDSSLIIEEIRRGSEMLGRIYDQVRMDKMRVIVPTAVILELWAGRSMQQLKTVQAVKDIYQQFEIVLLTEKIAQQAGNLIRSYGLEAMDAAIAATAIEENAYLATHNTKHFQHVPQLLLWA